MNLQVNQKSFEQSCVADSQPSLAIRKLKFVENERDQIRSAVEFAIEIYINKLIAV